MIRPGRGLWVATICLLLPGAAIAGPKEDAEAAWQADAAEIRERFAIPADDDVASKLAESADLRCDTVNVESEFDAFSSRIFAACTSTLPTADEVECRSAAVLLVVVHRMRRLENGDDSGFRFEVGCDGVQVTGQWPAIRGPLEVQETRTGGATGDVGIWTMNLGWQKLPPDVDDPDQWERAVLVPSTEVLLALDRVQRAIGAGDATAAEQTRALVEELVGSAISEVEAFPDLPDDAGLRAAEVAWMNGVVADLDHGDLHTLVQRMSLRPRKSVKRQTQKIARRQKKASDAAEQTLAQAVDAFEAKHPGS